ncbi:MAG: DUF1549 and DUF1553 domain-containing protein [Bacteroidales bacterium]|nr:DUF1549 and DUF1553 domain-containing protein [Bacteroidales bacterium]
MLTLLVASLPTTAAVPPAPAAPVSFQRDVIPIMTAAGCNQGACHGTPTGKNGFRLSLRGYDPALDYQTITREMGGRRIHRLDPDASLLLVKGSGLVPHGGGKRFEPHGQLYAIVRAWIAAGAMRDQAEPPTQLTVSPAHTILDAPVDRVTLRVSATFADGTQRDVTHLTRFSVNDPVTASVDASGIVRRNLRGEVAIAAEYMGRMATAVVLFRDPVPGYQPPQFPAVNFVDTILFERWKELLITPGALCTDGEFLRRATLDITGRIPTVEETRQFLTDAAPDKRERLINRLLDSEDFTAWWTQKWADRLSLNNRFVGKTGAVKFHAWIRAQMAANVPEDEFVRRILTASGPSYSHPPAGFYRRLRTPDLRGEEIAQLFMGVRMQCAKCHNHPGERWTQDEYYGLAAFFNQLTYRNGPFFNHIYDKEETIIGTHSGEVVQPRTGQRMPPKFLGGAVPTISPHEDRRAVFAHWLTAPDNPFFAPAAGNRIWYHLFGRGLVDPVDDIRSTNPAVSEPLLAALAQEFQRVGYDRKQLIRTIVLSRTYQLSSAAMPGDNELAEKYFARYPVRRLGAEQLLDAITQATGVVEAFPSLPVGTQATELPDGEYKHPFLEAFGRPARAMVCECERESDTNLIQALQLIGGTVTNTKARSPQGRAALLAASNQTPDAILEELFLATLTRRPTDAERQLVLPAFARNRTTAAMDLLHSLLNHPEFVFQH